MMKHKIGTQKHTETSTWVQAKEKSEEFICFPLYAKSLINHVWEIRFRELLLKYFPAFSFFHTRAVKCLSRDVSYFAETHVYDERCCVNIF